MNLENQGSSDFNLDFSSNGSGKVMSLESFIDSDSALIEKKDELVIGDNPSNDDAGKGLEDFLENPIVKPDDKTPDPDNLVISDNSSTPKLDDVIDNVPVANSNLYKGIINQLVENKVWDAIEAFETEEGLISFEDADIDAEMFQDIFVSKIEEIKEKANANKVSTEKISEFTQKLIEIEANGGSVAQALESYQKYKNPLENLDLSLESDQQAAIYLKAQASGLPDSDIVDLITMYKTNGILEEKAIQAKSDLDVAFEKQMDAINQDAIDRKNKYQESLKLYKSNLSDNLKSFDLNDTYRKKLLDVATKEDANGKFELDRIYAEQRQDPNKAAELLLFLTNRDEYNKQITEKATRNQELGTMKKLKLVPKSKASISLTGDDDKSNSKNKHFTDLNDI